MQTYHAETVVKQDGELVLAGLPFSKGDKVEVVVRPAHDDDAAWRHLAIESFFRDASEKDADYDRY